MNREILFKAKTTKKDNPINAFNNVWVEGDLVRSGGKYYIHPIANKVKIDGELGKVIIMHEVDPDTLCQYTGLTDKNGQKIWENDIVKHKDSQCFGTIRWYCGDYVGWCVDDVHDYEQQFTMDMFNECEVVGNIFDAKELLEVEQ